MSRLLLLCGSQRRASLNARLLGHVAGLVPAGHMADLVPPAQIDLPLFHQDCEGDGAIRARLVALHARFAAADGLIVASPEYNGLMSPFLKNTIDWVSRLPRLDAGHGNAFLDKPVLLCSATPGWSGGALGIPALRTLFGHVGAIPFGETICLPHAQQGWDEAGRPNPNLAAFGWQACVARFCGLVANQTSGQTCGAKP
jgi:chromate reductase